MNKDLYFIPLIAEALQRPSPQQGLREAFEEIKKLSSNPDYTQGFWQFQRFMSEAQKAWERPNKVTEEALHEVMKELAGGLPLFSETDTEDLLHLIKSLPDWRKKLSELFTETSKPEAAYIAPTIIIKKGGEYINSIKLENLPVTKEIKNVKPGNYEFMLDTGRLLWEDSLTEKDLLWAYAFPEQDLPLAADTGGETIPRPTREMRLLNGEVIIRIFPEIETGRIEVEVTGEEDG